MLEVDPAPSRPTRPEIRILRPPRAPRARAGLGLRGIALGFVAGVVASLSLMGTAQDASRTPSVGGVPLPDVNRIADGLDLIRRHGLRELSASEITDGCVAGMARAADPESEYYDEARFAELRQSGPLRAGLGLELRTIDDLPVVVAPIDGGPAARAGVQPGDRLIRIDGAVTGGLSLSEVVKRLQGEPRSTVALTIRRSGVEALVELTLEREFIRRRPVQARRLDNGMAYVRVSQFGDDTLRGLVTELSSQGRESVPTALLLDLRSNPGGLLDAGIGVAAAFLPRDTPILTLRGRSADANREIRATSADYTRVGPDELARLPAWVKTVPVAVLVDGGSAAASEIVAGALQDHRRALIVGERSFGRGSIQTVFPMSGRTGLRLTTAEWIRPAGTPISGKGITPDLVSRRAAGSSEDTVLAAAMARLAGTR